LKKKRFNIRFNKRFVRGSNIKKRYHIGNEGIVLSKIDINDISGTLPKINLIDEIAVDTSNGSDMFVLRDTNGNEIFKIGRDGSTYIHNAEDVINEFKEYKPSSYITTRADTKINSAWWGGGYDSASYCCAKDTADSVITAVTAYGAATLKADCCSCNATADCHC